MEEGQFAKFPIVDGTRNILSPNDIRAVSEKYHSYLRRFSPSSFPLSLSSLLPSFPFLIRIEKESANRFVQNDLGCAFDLI